jgi:glutathione S-transferase
MASMTPQVAVEHARDGADCMKDSDKIIQRLAKSYPDQASKLTKASGLIREARTLLTEVELALSSAISK